MQEIDDKGYRQFFSNKEIFRHWNSNRRRRCLWRCKWRVTFWIFTGI
ncbi:MAG: hypothetical protein ACRENG_36255 [bacterium]